MRLEINRNILEIKSLADVDLAKSTLETHHPDLYSLLYFWCDEKQTSLAVDTSGSTGKPKSIKISKSSFTKSAQITCDYFGLNAGSKICNALPIKYIAGKMMVIRAIVSGATLISHTPSIQIEIPKCDFIALTPMQVKSSLETLDKANQVLIGGGEVSLGLIDLLQSYSAKCYASFGMTETITHCAIQSLNHPKKEYYHVLGGFFVSVSDDNLLIIKAQHIPESPVFTNDVVELTSKKSFRWLGRVDFVINSGGVKIQPEEIEDVLKKDLNLAFFICGVKDENLGEAVGMVVLESYDKQELLASLNQFKDQLGFKLPKYFATVSEFKTTATHKIIRRAEVYELEWKKIDL